MKRLCLLLAVLVLVFAACSNEPAQSLPEIGESITTEELEKLLSENEIAFPEEYRAFWQSDCGKEILDWSKTTDHNLFIRRFDEKTVLYYCEYCVYLDFEGEIFPVLDGAFVDPDIISYSDGKLSVPMSSGKTFSITHTPKPPLSIFTSLPLRKECSTALKKLTE